MWDEEKFFKDFAEATDRIKPDAAFVEQLKEKMNSENVVQLEMRMKKRKQIRISRRRKSKTKYKSISFKCRK